MLDFVKKVEKSGLLASGERCEAAAVVLPAGSLARMAMRSTGGLVGTAMAGALGDKNAKEVAKANEALGGGLAATFPAGMQMTIAATDRRLVVMKNSAMTGSPKDVIGSFAWDQIAGAEVDAGALKKRVLLRFVDGTGVALEAGKVVKIETVADVINARAARPTGG